MINISTTHQQRSTSSLERDLVDGVYTGSEAREFASGVLGATLQTQRHRDLRSEIRTGSGDEDAASAIAELESLKGELTETLRSAQEQGRRVRLRCTISVEIEDEDQTPLRR